MSPTPTVLVYDDALETSEVLAAVYEPRGFDVSRMPSRQPASVGSMAGTSVVVLRAQNSEPAGESGAPLKVVIGRVADLGPAGDSGRVSACGLSSLFDYRELVSAIDRLLCGSA